MKVAIMYYTRTGNTEVLVKFLSKVLKSYGLNVDVIRITPFKEYSQPLHFNPRLIFDTLIKKGTSILLKPENLDVEKYNIIIVASPIWFNTLASPVQQLLKIYANKLRQYIILTTSELRISCGNIIKKIGEITHVKPVYCLNVTVSEIRNETELKRILREIANKVLSLYKS